MTLIHIGLFLRLLLTDSIFVLICTVRLLAKESLNGRGWRGGGGLSMGAFRYIHIDRSIIVLRGM